MESLRTAIAALQTSLAAMGTAKADVAAKTESVEAAQVALNIAESEHSGSVQTEREALNDAGKALGLVVAAFADYGVEPQLPVPPADV